MRAGTLPRLPCEIHCSDIVAQQVLEGYKSAQKGTSVDPSSYDHVASEHGTGNAKAVRSPPDPFTSPRTDGEGSRSVSSRRGEKTSARVKARQNAVMKSRQISVPLSPGKASSPQRRQPSSDAFEEATPRPQRLRERDQPTPLSVEPMPPLQASSATKRMPFRELQPHEVPMSSTPTGISRHPAIDGSGKRQGAYRAGGPGSEAKQQRHHQQQPAAQQTQDVNRLYGQTCHLRDNLSSFLATLGLFRQDVLPYDLVRSQAIEADQVASAYSGTISNFANGPLGTHFGRFFSEISGFCLAMQPRLRTLVAGTMDAFSPGGIDAMASLDAVEKLAQFFQAKLSAFAGALEQAMSGGVTQQPQQGIRERYAPSPAGADQRRPYVDYIDPGVRSAQQPQAHTPRSALRAQAGIRSAGRSHPDAGTVDLLSPTSSVGSFCEDGEGSKRRRKSGPSSKKAPAYVHRTRVVVWRMDIDSKADPATIPPRIGTGHAMILHNNKVTWTSDEKAVDPVELVISECTVRRFNLPWQGPAEGEEVDEKDKNVVWITMGSNGGASSAQLVVDKENSALMTPANRKRPRSVAGTPQANVAKATEIKPATYLMRCFASADAAEFCKLLAQQGATLVE